ncbi:hypothetical protein [Paraburkholderia sp. BCC1886]|uniref:hypothetical protein n=1 Tax=Paraburkholderia sp. BCC1886 TaxID=2562670 RepID=UPI0011834C4D|nr:hypothetical protein [Paraburkholderia sp. BCC1886]
MPYSQKLKDAAHALCAMRGIDPLQQRTSDMGWYYEAWHDLADEIVCTMQVNLIITQHALKPLDLSDELFHQVKLKPSCS